MGRGSRAEGNQWTPPLPGNKKTPTKHPKPQGPGSSDDDEKAAKSQTKTKKQIATPATALQNRVQRAKGPQPASKKKGSGLLCAAVQYLYS